MMCWEIFLKFLQCVKTGNKRINKINLNKFIWFNG